MAKALTTTEFHFKKQKSLYHGKVRDVYNIGDDMLVMVATDRISAFDVILPKGIPFKGQVLNQIASTFLDATADIVPNWKLATPDPMVTVGLKCEGFRVEMIIRGYLTGSAWREYKNGCRSICGVTLPEGMRENEKFPTRDRGGGVRFKNASKNGSMPKLVNADPKNTGLSWPRRTASRSISRPADRSSTSSISCRCLVSESKSSATLLSYRSMACFSALAFPLIPEKNSS